MSLDTILLLYPEIVVLVIATWTYVGGAFTRRRTMRWSWFALGGLAVAGYQLWRQDGRHLDLQITLAAGSDQLFTLMYVARWAALAAGAVFVLAYMRSAADGQTGEIVGSVLMVTAGMMVVAGAADLVLLFLGLELISIPTYILLYLGRRDKSAAESVTKYFFLSILSSGLLLYGFSFLYGLGGSTDLATIRDRLAALTAASGAGPLASIALVLVVAGLSFRLAAVPFHYYAPDVYEGTSSVNAGLLAVAPKIAGVVALVRLLSAMPGMAMLALGIVAAVALLTMTLGNLLALWQTSLRRMLAYSSIAHGGYLLIGLAVALTTTDTAPNSSTAVAGLAAALFYVAVYAVASFGAFAVLAYLDRGDREVETLDDLAGIGRTNPQAAALLAVFMFSLAGIPPLIGFWGKLALFTGPLDIYMQAQTSGGANKDVAPWLLALAVVGVLNAAVAAAYYLRIVAAAYFRVPQKTVKAQGGYGALAAATVCGLATLAGGAFPGPGLDLARSASITTLDQFKKPIVGQGLALTEPPLHRD